MRLRVLVACEYSGAVRDAFTALGHYALSCDLLPSETPGNHHQGDVLELLDEGWDLMVAHPPCTYLSRSGRRWLFEADDDRPGKLKGAPRWKALEEALEFFAALQAAPIPRVAIENPEPHDIAAAHIGRPSLYVQPWEFGHGESKKTGLWLKGLPPLMPTDLVVEREAKVHLMPPGPNRWKERSRTYPGIAAAMADQWGAWAEAAA